MVPTTPAHSVQKISVIVPANPFVTDNSLRRRRHCLAALDVVKLMQWWPGTPHTPHRNPQKVLAIQRSLDWKRVAQIAAYLLQREIVDAPEKLNTYFKDVYEPRADEAGREWPPRISQVVKYQRSAFPTFSNVLLHVNGAELNDAPGGAATLQFDENDKGLNFSVIDGQHRINGAYFAVCLLRETQPKAKWEIPAEVFIDLDPVGQAPRHQAQIFIDVNFYQKKVDRSLVADLFPTARGRDPLDDKERAQDLGRRLMLDVGPLVGMVQIPGIKYGVKDVVTLATLNAAIEDILPYMKAAGIAELEAQADFTAQCLDAWLEAAGRKQDLFGSESLDPDNVAYQGRVIVSFLTLLPACILELKKAKVHLISEDGRGRLTNWLREVMKRAGLLRHKVFLAKPDFSRKGFLGSGGLARFRDRLWAATSTTKTIPANARPQKVAELAAEARAKVSSELGPENEG